MNKSHTLYEHVNEWFNDHKITFERIYFGRHEFKDSMEVKGKLTDEQAVEFHLLFKVAKLIQAGKK